MKQEGTLVLNLPLWKVLDFDAGYLRYEIERVARAFGFEQMKRAAISYGAPEVTVEIRIRQPFETAETA